LPKILVIDIEWAPALVYTFDMWNSNASPDKIIDHGGMLCFCAHWYGTKEYLFYSLWDNGRDAMAKAALDLLTEADAVVTYNGIKYDIPKITGEIVLAGLNPPPKVAQIDLIRTVKKFGFNMNRLAYIAPLLKIGNKMKHQGFDLWKDVMAGDAKAQTTMKRYCIQDVKITTKLYNRIKPFIQDHPALRHGDGCTACGSNKTQKRGPRVTRFFSIQRNQCQSCGHWFETTRTRIKTNTTTKNNDDG
jgi:RNase_H superfamily